MIAELSVQNIAIIERITLEFHPGLTALTGETGAGKSLLIDAIELALGDRADSDLIRSGSPSAKVSIRFTDPDLLITRVVPLSGRSTCQINGEPETVGALRALGRQLVDMHGQHDHQSLLDPAKHLLYLDEWIGESAATLLAKVAVAHERWTDARRRLQTLRSHQRDREQRVDMLRYQIAEIEAVQPEVGEMANLEVQLDRLKHAERLTQAAVESLDRLADSEACAVDSLNGSLKTLQEVHKFDPALDPSLNLLQDAAVHLQEGIHLLRNYLDQIDADPARLEEIAGRLDALRKLFRKYGESEAEVLAFLNDAHHDLQLLEDDSTNEATLITVVDQAHRELLADCQALSDLRRARAIEFSSHAQTQLRDLAMDRAVFEVSFSAKEPEIDGIDRAEFYFSANAGESPKALAKIASGGELSRVMLAIKTALAGRAGVPTLIFDEVDAGLGGRAAATVARKLAELGRNYQVIVISHLPQIAARADHHYHIDKVESGDRVVTSVRKLEHEDRVAELARMLGGEVLTETALANAREMLS